jgi:hypothetical protein
VGWAALGDHYNLVSVPLAQMAGFNWVVKVAVLKRMQMVNIGFQDPKAHT